MKTELLALIDDLVKSELYVTEGKFSAAKDAKRIRADIVFLLDKAEQAQAPAAKCETCNDNGLIGGPSFYDPGEGGVPCPDCSAPTAVEPVMKESKTELLTAVRTAPERIWLDLGVREAMDENFRNLDEVTWSAENATGHGVAYIRADLVEAAPADAPDALDAFTRDACKRLCEEVAEDETARGRCERANGARECAAQILMAHEIVRKHHRAARGAKP